MVSLPTSDGYKESILGGSIMVDSSASVPTGSLLLQAIRANANMTKNGMKGFIMDGAVEIDGTLLEKYNFFKSI